MAGLSKTGQEDINNLLLMRTPGESGHFQLNGHVMQRSFVSTETGKKPEA
jgi:hypothetical protein